MNLIRKQNTWFPSLIDDFINSILDERDVTGITQGIFDAISVCAASDRSMKTGRPEKINYV